MVFRKSACCQTVLLLFMAGLCVDAAPKLELRGDFASIYPENRKPAFVLRGTPGEGICEVEDAFGKRVLSLRAHPGRTVEISGLPCGYYVIRHGGASRSFAILRDAERGGGKRSSSFCLDVAAGAIPGAHAYDPKDIRKGLRLFASLAELSGAAMIRERLSMNIYGKDGAASLQENHPCTMALRNLQEKGLPVCVTYHKAPARFSDNGITPNHLVFVHEFARKAAADFPGVSIWEFWNEQDTERHWPASAWDFASFCKAASLGHRTGNPSCSVTAGNIARAAGENTKTKFFEVAYRSGLAHYADFNSVHWYGTPASNATAMKRWRELGRRWGCGDMAVLVSESGSSADARFSGVVPTGFRSALDHSPEVEMLTAEWIPKAQIQMRQAGAVGDFLFVLPPCNEREGRKPYGLVRYDYTVKPGFVTFAVLCRELGNAEMLGKVSAPEGVEAYAFRQKDGSCSLVFWRRSWVDTEAVNKMNAQKAAGSYPAIRFGFPAVSGTRLVNAFGSPERMAPENGRVQLSAERFPKYLHGLRQCAVSVPAAERGRPGRVPFDGDASIVSRLIPGEGTNDGGRIHLVLNRGKESRVKIQLVNFGTRPKSGFLEHGGLLKGLPDSILLEPGKLREYEAVISTDKAQDALVLSGRFGGKKITPLTVPLISFSGALKNFRPLSAGPERWLRNCAGGAEAMNIRWDEQEKAVRFEVAFPEKNRDLWVYPELPLKLPEESPAGAIGLMFEIKMVLPPDAPPPKWNFVMLVESSPGGKTTHIGYGASNGKWESCFASFTGVDSAKIGSLRIGMNPSCRKAVFYLRNLCFIR